MYPSNLSVHDVKVRANSPTNLSAVDAPATVKPASSELPSHIRGSALNQSFAQNRVSATASNDKPISIRVFNLK